MRPGEMRGGQTGDGRPAVFLLGKDYHLGDLLWFTAVLKEYRRQRAPSELVVGIPDRDISRILEHSPVIDHLLYGDPRSVRRLVRSQYGRYARIHDLRARPIGIQMVKLWRHRNPVLYYRDLWVQPRGQWLATFLRLGWLPEFRPQIRLVDRDQWPHKPESPYVVLAPRVGSYSVPVMGRIWGKVKAWDNERWEALAGRLGNAGFQVATLAAKDQKPVRGTVAILGLPIRQAASVIQSAAGLISGESGLWFIAAALDVPFVIVPWWLPYPIDWAAPMNVPHHLIRRTQATVDTVLTQFLELARRESPD